MPPKSDNNRKTRSHSHTLDDPSENKGDNMAVFEGTGNTPEVLANTESKGATTNNDDLRMHLIQQLSTTVRTSNSNIQSSIDQLSRKIDDQHATFSAELRELRTSLTDAQAEISDLKSTNQRRQTVIANLERDQTRSQQSIRTLNCQVQRMKCALTKQETYSRKQNIVIDGLDGDWALAVRTKMMTWKINLGICSPTSLILTLPYQIWTNSIGLGLQTRINQGPYL